MRDVVPRRSTPSTWNCRSSDGSTGSSSCDHSLDSTSVPPVRENPHTRHSCVVSEISPTEQRGQIMEEGVPTFLCDSQRDIELLARAAQGTGTCIQCIPNSDQVDGQVRERGQPARCRDGRGPAQRGARGSRPTGDRDRNGTPEGEHAVPKRILYTDLYPCAGVDRLAGLRRRGLDREGY